MVSRLGRIVRRNGTVYEAVRSLTRLHLCLGILFLCSITLTAIAQERPEIVWRRGISGNSSIMAAFSADGSLIASAHSNPYNSIKLWRVEDEVLLGVKLLYDGCVGQHCYGYSSCCFGESFYSGSPSCSYSSPIFAYSPDGNTFAAGMGGLCTEDYGYRQYSIGRIVLLRSDGTGETIDTGDSVNSIAFSQDGTVMVVASTSFYYNGYYDYNGWITIRRLDSGRSISIHLPREDVHHVAISPDGTLLASIQSGHVIDEDGYETQFNDIKLWRVNDGTLVRTIAGVGNRVAFSPDGSLIASWSSWSSESATIAFWRVEDGELIRTLHIQVQGSGTYNERWVFSPDWSMIASIVGSTIKLWRVSDGSLVHTLVGHANEVRILAFSPNGGLLASGGQDRTIRIWRVEDGSLMHTLTGHSSVSSVAFAPDARLLVSTGGDAIRLWNVEDGSLVRTLGERGSLLRFSPDGRLLAAMSDPRTIELRRLSDGSIVRTIEHTAPIVNLSLSPDSRLIASATENGAVHVWRVADGSLMYTLRGIGVGSDIVFSPDGSVLASGCRGRTIGIWRVSDGSLMYTLTGCGAFDFSPSGELIALMDDGAVKLFRVEDGALLRTITGSRPYDVFKFSPDGQMIAAGSRYADQLEPSKVELWRVEDGTQVGTILFDAMDCDEYYRYLPLDSFTLSPDGSVLAMWGGNVCYWDIDGNAGGHGTIGRVQLWSLLDYSPIDIYNEYSYVKSLSFSPDGKAIAYSWYQSEGWYSSQYQGPHSSHRSECFGIGLERVGNIQEHLNHCEVNESVQFSPNGRVLAIVGNHGSFVVLRNPYWRSGDANGDGCVDDADLLRVLDSFGADDGGLEDMNGDNVVDDADLLLVLFNFGSGC